MKGPSGMLLFDSMIGKWAEDCCCLSLNYANKASVTIAESLSQVEAWHKVSLILLVKCKFW